MANRGPSPTPPTPQHPLRASPAGTSGVWRVTSGLSAALPAVSSTSPYFRPSGGLSPARAEKTADRLRLPSPPRWGPQEKRRRLLGRDLCRQKKRGTVPSSERADFEAIGGKTRSNGGLPAVPPHPPVPGGSRPGWMRPRAARSGAALGVHRRVGLSDPQSSVPSRRFPPFRASMVVVSSLMSRTSGLSPHFRLQRLPFRRRGPIRSLLPAVAMETAPPPRAFPWRRRKRGSGVGLGGRRWAPIGGRRRPSSAGTSGGAVKGGKKGRAAAERRR